MGIFDEVRKVFAGTREAKQRGYGTGRFSFNVKGGRCEECQGHGVKKIEMQFLPNLYVVCPVCEGKRFNRQTLEIRYKGLSIADVLDLGIDEALTVFENFPQISRSAQKPARSWPRLSLAGPIGHDALRRRSPTRETRRRIGPHANRQHAVPAR